VQLEVQRGVAVQLEVRCDTPVSVNPQGSVELLVVPRHPEELSSHTSRPPQFSPASGHRRMSTEVFSRRKYPAKEYSVPCECFVLQLPASATYSGIFRGK
jgi:hypothetical protein